MNLIEKIITASKKTQKKVPGFQGALTYRNTIEKAGTLKGSKKVPGLVPGEKHQQKTGDYSLGSSSEENLNPNSKDGPEFSRSMEKENSNSKDCCRCCGFSMFWRMKGQERWICSTCHPPAISKRDIEWQERNREGFTCSDCQHKENEEGKRVETHSASLCDHQYRASE